MNLNNNIICEKIIRKSGGWLLDEDNILWKIIDGKWIGKRSVYTFDLQACWLEDTNEENIRNWWCGGKNANYTEIFNRM